VPLGKFLSPDTSPSWYVFIKNNTRLFKDLEILLETSLVHSTSNANMQPITALPKHRELILRDHDLEPVKARVIELHIAKDLPLPKVKQSLLASRLRESTATLTVPTLGYPFQDPPTQNACEPMGP